MRVFQPTYVIRATNPTNTPVTVTPLAGKFGVGSTERWFGFSNRLLNFTYDGTGK